VSGIAIVGFGPGTVTEEPIGALCTGCRQPVRPGQRGYLLRSQGLTEEAWHRSCSRDPSARTADLAWPEPQPDHEAAITGHSTSGAARSMLGS